MPVQRDAAGAGTSSQPTGNCHASKTRSASAWINGRELNRRAKGLFPTGDLRAKNTAAYCLPDYQSLNKSIPDKPEQYQRR